MGTAAHLLKLLVNFLNMLENTHQAQLEKKKFKINEFPHLSLGLRHKNNLI